MTTDPTYQTAGPTTATIPSCGLIRAPTAWNAGRPLEAACMDYLSADGRATMKHVWLWHATGNDNAYIAIIPPYFGSRRACSAAGVRSMAYVYVTTCSRDRFVG